MSAAGPGPGLRLGLSLSGGGVRAAVFHLGVLRRLAEDDLLESVSAVSTVSGGSLLVAAVLSRSNLLWPTSRQFLSEVYPALRRLITTTDLFSLGAVGWSGLVRHNVRVLTDRAGLLVDFLESRWNVTGALRDLPDEPIWWTNATCIETGKNWRFSKSEMGDWEFGRHYEPPFRIAQAAVASAAVPYGIGALRLKLPREGWHRTDPATRAPVGKREPYASEVSLWDGGAYENLGLEAMYKPGEVLRGCNFLVCSDASGPLGPPRPGLLRSIAAGELWAPRLFDVASDQIRALRSRMLVRDFERGTVRGVLIRMGNSVRDVDVKAGRARAAAEYDRFQSDQEGRLALQHPTDLNAVPEQVFDRLARHGFETADATLTARAPDAFARSVAWIDLAIQLRAACRSRLL